MSEFFSSEYWFSSETLLGVTASIGAVIVCFLEQRRYRFIGILALLAIFWLSAAWLKFSQSKSDRDYVYLVLPKPEQQNILPGDKVQLWTKATAKLTNADTCWLRTADYSNIQPVYCRIPRFQWAIPEGYRPSSLVVGMDDWTFDLDAPNRYGQVRQRLDLVKNNGAVVLIYSQVFRKGTSPLEILCENPKREGVPLCQ